MGQVAQVILESGESDDDLSVDSESRDLIGDPFFSLRDYIEDRLAQSLQSGSLRLLQIRQVQIDLVTGHVFDSCDTRCQGQELHLRLNAGPGCHPAVRQGYAYKLAEIVPATDVSHM